MKMVRYSMLWFLLCLFAGGVQAQVKNSAEDLLEWNFYGQGTTGTWGKQFYMKEDRDQSKGVMIVSPDTYGDQVVLKYEVMTLTPATVCVAILSASSGDDGGLEIPEDYDGAMGLWSNELDNYFFAFRNAPHGFTPFLRKYPISGGGNVVLDSAEENVMSCGEYHQAEVGGKGTRLWLKIDGETILDANDEETLGGGHIALRLRGTAGEHAACLIKNLTVE